MRHLLEETRTEAQVPAAREVQPFVFATERRLVVLTGLKATTLNELLEHLTKVAGASIFYHTHYLYLRRHFVKPRFYNAFANWVSYSLRQERLAEQLGNIDLLSMTSIRALREAIIEVIQRHLETNHDGDWQCSPEEAFHFCEAKSFVMKTGLVAHSAEELARLVPQVTNACLHFHFFEARLRLERPTNDFSQWLTGIGEEKLARRIDRVNPYVMTLDELKAEIAKLGRWYLRRSK